jgi:hypothetical protein
MKREVPGQKLFQMIVDYFRGTKYDSFGFYIVGSPLLSEFFSAPYRTATDRLSF